MNLKEQITAVSQVVEDEKFALSRKRSPKTKRQSKQALNFWDSILKSLNELEKLKKNERRAH